jgi:hypothetical protein
MTTIVTVQFDMPKLPNTPMERCRRLSAFEGKEAKGGDEGSLFKSVMLTEQDKPLLIGYFREGCDLCQDMIGSRLKEGANGYMVDDDGATFDFDGNMPSRARKSFGNALCEALTSYGMYKWLANKMPERSEQYKVMWEQMIKLCVKAALLRPKPTI